MFQTLSFHHSRSAANKIGVGYDIEENHCQSLLAVLDISCAISN